MSQAVKQRVSVGVLLVLCAAVVALAVLNLFDLIRTPNLVVAGAAIVVSLMVLGLATGWVPTRRRRN